ncbi:cinnamoyl-CoA reductase 1-like [Henckelia pumila]|uniref:cinnamoyl-CoA reductase 1-like n=1 Tax=Henckelia pumila TaxID=405737 RepID=UPI003C6E8733
MAENGRVCVTGAGGYIASWLIKLLLSKSYIVHGTVRDPGDDRNVQLKNLEFAAEKLKLFKADLLDYYSVLAAIGGCDGVFHVASPVPSGPVSNPEVELVEPAVKGTLNVLKACTEAKVRRVVFVSSAAAVIMNPNLPKDQLLDETCWSDAEYCKMTNNWYCYSKTVAEIEALGYAKKSGLEVISFLPCLVVGPMLSQKANASSLVLINLLKGGNEQVVNHLRKVVDVRDVAEALKLVYETPEAEGRYLCMAHTVTIQGLVENLRKMYPDYKYPKSFQEGTDSLKLTSGRLQKLGWRYRPLKETLIDAVESYKRMSMLDS